ncbi:hypothetical protein E0W72_09430 [Flavobacterium arcticum]|nr:hypothetical protein [Flavobacterium arcticum]KAF2509726.1 hypothetical protein E0W72_09430 [Flavobacterium arcticum]
MRKIFILLFIVFTTVTAQAQFDSNTGSISVPKGNTTSTDTPSLSTTSPFTVTPPKPTVSNPYQVGANSDSNFSMYQKDEFVSRSSEYMDRVQVKVRESESNEPYRGNIDFGVIKTKSPYIVLMARDFGAEDGDRVKVTVNSKIIVANVTLTNRGAAIMITLSEGFNNIQIEALNQGTSGPNTADFGVKDNEEKMLARNEWNLATGFYAKFIVVKE